LKLTTDRHKASRGLFATAELLVDSAAQLDSWELPSKWLDQKRSVNKLARAG